ncbi:hypothetical protein [Oricola sp.]|uniref:hypothetical protein n=1 Tax=Oricola sp. TaxID=1979950 RepID=UPI003BA87AAA
MFQVLFFAGVVGVGIVGYRAFVREAERVSARVRRAEKEAKNRASGTLVEDENTGEYRVKGPDE